MTIKDFIALGKAQGHVDVTAGTFVFCDGTAAGWRALGGTMTGKERNAFAVVLAYADKQCAATSGAT